MDNLQLCLLCGGSHEPTKECTVLPESFLMDNKAIIRKYTDAKGFNILHKHLTMGASSDRYARITFRDTISKALNCAEYSLREHKHVLYKLQRMGKSLEER